MKFNIIVAYCKNFGIGYQNSIPWNLKKDLKHFRNITLNSHIIMGRLTWESLPFKPLQNRNNIVITSQKIDDVTCYNTLDESLKNIPIDNKKIFVIGGEQLYREAIAHKDCELIYVTEINQNFNCDRFFPCINRQFSLINHSELFTENEVSFRYLTYKKKEYEYYAENAYLNVLRCILDHGNKRKTRSGNTLSLFGSRLEFDLNSGIPLLTTKKMAWKTCLKELLWFLSGSTDNKILQKQNVNIWNGNTSREYLDKYGFINRKEGDLGPGYGFQFRYSGAKYIDCNTNYHGQGIDQINECIRLIKEDPNSRRIVMSLWTPSDIPEMSLAPCHGIAIQFYVNNGTLDCQMYQRSGDMFLGIPFNIFSYSVLTLMISHLTNLKPGKLILVIGDLHIYSDHISACQTQLKRHPRAFPILNIKRDIKNIDDFKLDDFELIGYHPYDSISAKMNI